MCLDNLILGQLFKTYILKILQNILETTTTKLYFRVLCVPI